MEIEHIEEITKNVDQIEHVEKFNPYHGKDGRFSSKNGGGGSSSSVGGKGKKGYKSYSKNDLYDALPGTSFLTEVGEKYVVSREKGVLHRYNSKGMYGGDTNIEHFYRNIASQQGLKKVIKKTINTIDE